MINKVDLGDGKVMLCNDQGLKDFNKAILDFLDDKSKYQKLSKKYKLSK